MLDADRRLLETLHTWEPAGGVLSVAFEIDPADRGEGWRVALREGLEKCVDSADPHAERRAVQAAVDRVLSRFPDETSLPHGRTHVGFVEVAEKGGEENWRHFQLPLGEFVVARSQRPRLAPLVRLTGRGGRHRVVAVSSERVTGWVWENGELRAEPELDADMEIVPGRERKGPSMREPGRGQSQSSSGKDQYGQHLEANRERFLHEVGKRLSGVGRSGGFGRTVVIGEAPSIEAVLAGAGGNDSVWADAGHNVINEPEGRLLERVDAVVAEMHRAECRELVAAAIDAAMASAGNGSVGLDATATALVEGQVDRLAYDAALRVSVEDLGQLAADAARERGQDDGVEAMIALALDTSATVAAIEPPEAEPLAEHGGVAAVLRY